MKREGRRHGVQMGGKLANHHDEYSITGNRSGCCSKHAGKRRRPWCSECHSLPASKSRGKAKGAQKLRSCNVMLNHKLVSWRVVDNGHWQKFGGTSANDLLNELDEDDDEDQIEGHGDEFQGCVSFAEEEEEEEEANDDYMGFCEVGFIMEYLEGEDWCMVDEISSGVLG